MARMRALVKALSVRIFSWWPRKLRALPPLAWMARAVSVPGDLLAAIDRDAAQRHATRSGVIESWLRRAAFARGRQDLEAATEAYYLALTREETAESLAIAKGLSRAARRVRIDE